MLEVIIVSPGGIIFKGQAKSVILPGEFGVFEILLFHKRILSRLIRGSIDVDGKAFPILRGVVKVDKNAVFAVIEQEKAEELIH